MKLTFTFHTTEYGAAQIAEALGASVITSAKTCNNVKYRDFTPEDVVEELGLAPEIVTTDDMNDDTPAQLTLTADVPTDEDKARIEKFFEEPVRNSDIFDITWE